LKTGHYKGAEEEQGQTRLFSRILPALWPRNFQLFADGPHCPFLDFAMAGDAGDLV
jgi:hypothetical protein